MLLINQTRENIERIVNNLFNEINPKEKMTNWLLADIICALNKELSLRVSSYPRFIAWCSGIVVDNDALITVTVVDKCTDESFDISKEFLTGPVKPLPIKIADQEDPIICNHDMPPKKDVKVAAGYSREYKCKRIILGLGLNNEETFLAYVTKLMDRFDTDKLPASMIYKLTGGRTRRFSHLFTTNGNSHGLVLALKKRSSKINDSEIDCVPQIPLYNIFERISTIATRLNDIVNNTVPRHGKCVSMIESIDENGNHQLTDFGKTLYEKMIECNYVPARNPVLKEECNNRHRLRKHGDKKLRINNFLDEHTTKSEGLVSSTELRELYDKFTGETCTPKAFGKLMMMVKAKRGIVGKRTFYKGKMCACYHNISLRK